MDPILKSINYPDILRPTASTPFDIGGKRVLIPKATPAFNPWKGELPKDTYNRKAVLGFDGREAFAELAVLWASMKDGWKGAWIDSFKKVYRLDYWHSEPLLALGKSETLILQKIAGTNSFPVGCWDVFLMKSDQVLFVEAKRSKRDKINDNQISWLDRD